MPSDLLEVVAEPRRQEILRLVWDRERSAGDIAGRFDITFGAVSQHLQVLQRAGVVDVRREGRRRFYRARPDRLGPIAGYLEAMWRQKLGRLKTLAEAEEREAKSADRQRPAGAVRQPRRGRPRRP